MGSARWSPDAWQTHSAKTSQKSTAQIFQSSSMPEEFDPTKINIRESRDSDHNPNSTALVIGADGTGSMGIISDNLIRKGIGVVFEEVLDRKTISDPHLMVLGIGDVDYDQAPLQATQFEADLTIAEQLERLYIEHGGGGNGRESYNFAWLFAAEKTEIDCFEKRGKKGYLFTIGDEEPSNPITRAQALDRLGIELPADQMTNEELLTLVSRKYEVFHVMIMEGSHARGYPDRVKSEWTQLLGERAIPLNDYTKLAEVIVSAIEINEGRSVDDVVKSWDGDTSLVVGQSLAGLAKSAGAGGGDGVVSL